LYSDFVDTPFARDFDKYEFLRLPLGLIWELIQKHIKVVKREANLSSVTTARLCSIMVSIANGFAGNKTNKPVDIDQLLPFPLDEDRHALDQQTNRIAKELFRKRKIPLHVIAALNDLISF